MGTVFIWMKNWSWPHLMTSLERFFFGGESSPVLAVSELLFWLLVSYYLLGNIPQMAILFSEPWKKNKISTASN